MNAPLDFETIDLFDGDLFSPIQHELCTCTSKTIAACCGRRVGKTWSGSRKTLERVLEDMWEMRLEIEAGTRDRWIGESLRPSKAALAPPDVLVWVVAPRNEHLDQIRGVMLSILMRNGMAFQHPKFPEFFEHHNRHLWLWLDGVCGRIDFIPATGPMAMVSKGLNGVWIDEAGFVPNDRYMALKPTLWENRGWLLATGTPALGSDHWFTILAAAGLDKDHERYDPDVAKHDPEITTFIADTVHHAFSEDARKEALRDARFWGEIWAAQWVYADWRQRGLQVFRRWRPDVHQVRVRHPRVAPGRLPRIGGPVWCRLNDTPIATEPSTVYGVVDWSGGTAPGATVIAYVWKKNPLDPADPRPLVVVVSDYEGHDAYTEKGWWGILKEFERNWGVDRWIGDPHSPNLIKSANRAGIRMSEGAHQDKLGRISLVDALMNHDESQGVKSALYVSKQCVHTAREISGYKWRQTRDGKAMAKPKDYDDHCTDCLAMLAAEITSYASIAIGGKLFG